MARTYKMASKRKSMDLIKKRSQKTTKVMEEKTNEVVIQISLKSVLTVLAILGGLYLAYLLLDVIAMLFFALIIASATLPMIRGMVQRKVPKGVAIAIVYLISTLVIGGLLSLVVAPTIKEFSDIAEQVPEIIESFGKQISGLEVLGFSVTKDQVVDIGTNLVNNFSDDFASFGKSTVMQLFNIGGGVLTIVSVIILSVFIVGDHDTFVDSLLLRFVNEEQRRMVRKLVLDVEKKLGKWLMGQTLLSIIIGVMVYILLTLLDMPFALPLAMLAGLLESIPNLGPIFSSIPAIIIGFFTGGLWGGLLTMAGYTVIQQLENTFIVPRVLGNAVGLNAIVVMVGVIAGYALGGPIGALLAVPVIVLLDIAFTFYQDLQKLKAKGMV